MHHYLLARVSPVDEAMGLFTRATELDPSLVASHTWLANRVTSNDWSAALALRDQAWHADPSLPWTTIREAGA
jgi:hypothetical protein